MFEPFANLSKNITFVCMYVCATVITDILIESSANMMKHFRLLSHRFRVFIEKSVQARADFRLDWIILASGRDEWCGLMMFILFYVLWIGVFSVHRIYSIYQICFTYKNICIQNWINLRATCSIKLDSNNWWWLTKGTHAHI